MINLLLLLLVALIGLAYTLLQVMPSTPDQLLTIVWGAGLFTGGILLVRLTTYFLVDVLFFRAQGKEPSSLLRMIVAIALYSLCSIAIFSIGFRQDVAPLLATSALLAAILGFALQATLGNLFGGLSLQVEQLFGIGDWVEVDGVRGQIESLTWRSTALRSELGVLHIIPNSQITETTIQVIPPPPAYGDFLVVPAPLDIPPRRVIQIIDDVLLGIPDVSKESPTSTLVSEYDVANGSIRYEVSYSPATDDYGGVKSTILERVWYAFHRHGIAIPSLVPLSPPESGESEFDAVLHLLNPHPLFAAFDAGARTRLARSARRLLFAPGERVDLGEPVVDALCIILAGGLQAVIPETANPLNGRSMPSGLGLKVWSPDVLDEVEKKLSHFIGPIARHIVQTTAEQTVVPYQFFQMVAREIPDPVAQARFLADTPQVPSVYLPVGAVLGEMALFAGHPFVSLGLEAIGETELIKIDRAALAPLMQPDGDFFANQARALIAYHTQQSPFAYYHKQTAEFHATLRAMTSLYAP